MQDHSKLLSTSERGSISTTGPLISENVSDKVSLDGKLSNADGDGSGSISASTLPFVEDDGDEDMPSTATEDLQTLVYLLDVQLDIQERVIDGVLEHLNKSPRSSMEIPDDSAEEFDIKSVPGLMSSARAKVQKTIGKIVSVTEAREKKWHSKWKRERESKMRWEVCFTVICNG